MSRLARVDRVNPARGERRQRRSQEQHHADHLLGLCGPAHLSRCEDRLAQRAARRRTPSPGSKNPRSTRDADDLEQPDEEIDREPEDDQTNAYQQVGA
jgi:hypothetical protein